MRAMSWYQVEVMGPGLDPHAAPLLPILLRSGKERNKRLDWKWRPELASEKPESAGSYIPIAEGPSYRKGVGFYRDSSCSQPNQPGMVFSL